MNIYRSHHCNELRKEMVGDKVTLSGWINKKRDHGNILFIDLRDNYGITQCIIDKENPSFTKLEKIQLETVIQIEGKIVDRLKETVNNEISTGEIEVAIGTFKILGNCKELPLPVFSDQEYAEEIRLKYRFLDLRRKKIHENIILRSKTISFIRDEMSKLGFLEFQTPILTSSSPEGARDFLVPSRLNKGKFYALPQAPQQFKQLIMVSGFDKYFQIAPCFRDEDSRADRSPGEFYQLDLEMSYVEQEDVFEAVEPVIREVFKTFSSKKIDEIFPKITYKDSMLKYGNDKPDIRFALEIKDVTEVFKGSGFSIFAKSIETGSVVRAVPGPGCGSRSIADRMNSWAQGEGAPGMGYIIYNDNTAKGPIANALGIQDAMGMKELFNLEDGDALFFSCSTEAEASNLAGKARVKIATDKKLIEDNVFKFCWVVDYPMYEKDNNTGQIEFSHNPFSMPQGGMDALENKNPLDILAYQYDLVCNGIELSSGAIRNHVPEIMYKAFEIAGHKPEVVDNKFPGLINAFKFGAPPHGGIAPGIDRIVMLLADEPNIREVILFPMTGKAEDLMMNAPSDINELQLKELGLKLDKKIKMN